MSMNPELEPATARVEEFLRQYAIPVRPGRTDSITGIQADRDLDYMAELYATDLRMILDELARVTDRQDTLVIERYQAGARIADAAEQALVTRDKLQARSNDSIASQANINHHDGRAAGLREAHDILHKTAGSLRKAAGS